VTGRTVPPGSWVASLAGGAEVLSAGRLGGDFADPEAPSAVFAEHRLVGTSWTWLRQVHGARVVVVDRPGSRRGESADAAVTACPGAVLAVFTADCGPIGMASPEGVTGVAHAGWRGIVAGVVEATVAAMRSLGASDVEAAVGPCIAPHAYRFSPPELQLVVDRYGPGVVATDAEGYPALDLRAAVRTALERSGASLVATAATCTHCSAQHWSWRARQDSRRQVTVVYGPTDEGFPPGPGHVPSGRLGTGRA
jgi:YfiH family protein